jgi:hypothetical protein
MRLLSRLFTVALLAAPTVASAAAPYGMAGCGLGSMIFGPDSCQTSAATTNGSYFNQAFGITFGTSNCVGGGSKSLVEDIQKQFLADNYATLAKEMAQGQGETLITLSTMFGCDEASQPAFATTMQSAYHDIYAAPGVGASLKVIRSEVVANPNLSAHCTMTI